MSVRNKMAAYIIVYLLRRISNYCVLLKNALTQLDFMLFLYETDCLNIYMACLFIYILKVCVCVCVCVSEAPAASGRLIRELHPDKRLFIARGRRVNTCFH